MLKFVIYRDKKKEWRFRIVARNGKILCHSEGYKRKIDCRNAIYVIRCTFSKIIEED